jgi:archaellum biogenesis protein FlaJ (TadC family)
VCIQESDNPSFSSDLSAQIDIYSFKEAYSTMLFSNVGVLVFLIICVLLIRCCPKIIVFYIVLAFLIMLGFSFYVLKSIELRVEDKGIKEGSIFMAD